MDLYIPNPPTPEVDYTQKMAYDWGYRGQVPGTRIKIGDLAAGMFLYIEHLSQGPLLGKVIGVSGLEAEKRFFTASIIGYDEPVSILINDIFSLSKLAESVELPTVPGLYSMSNRPQEMFRLRHNLFGQNVWSRWEANDRVSHPSNLEMQLEVANGAQLELAG